MLLLDGKPLNDRMERELLRGEHARAAFAVHRQRLIAEAAKQIEYRHMEGLGTRLLIPLDPELVWRMRVKHGVDCLHDPEFRKSLWKKNPMLRADCRPNKFTIRVDGLRGQRSEVRGQGAETGEHDRGAGDAGHGTQPLVGNAASDKGDPAAPFEIGHETAVAIGAAIVLPEGRP